MATAKSAKRNGKTPATVEPEKYPREVTLASGVTLAIRKVSPWILQARVKNFKTPVPPIVKNEEKGREEENHNDPDFLLAQREYVASTAEAVTDTLLLMGTALKPPLPEGFEGPDSEEWDATLSALHLSDEGQDSKSRYLSWLKYTVLVDQEELGAVMAAVSRASGIASEVDIANAMAVFRSGEAQSADRDVASEVSGDGDYVPEVVTGSSTPDRGEVRS